MKWEYKVIEHLDVIEYTDEEMIKKGMKNFIDKYLTIDKLNQIGDDGWELVSYSPRFGAEQSVVIFKRPKNQG